MPPGLVMASSLIIHVINGAKQSAVKIHIDQTGASKEEAEEALKGTKGDLAQAIMDLKKEKEE